MRHEREREREREGEKHLRSENSVIFILFLSIVRQDLLPNSRIRTERILSSILSLRSFNNIYDNYL